MTIQYYIFFSTTFPNINHVVQVEGIAGEFGKRLLAGCDAERRVSVAGHSWRVEQRVRTDDFSAETTCIDDFAPNGEIMYLLFF